MKSMKAYLTTGQVHTLLCISPRAVCRLCDTGQLPSVRLPLNGRDRRIHQVDLAEFCLRHGYTRVLPALGQAFLPAVVSYTSSLQWGKQLTAELEGRLSVTLASSSYELGWECCCRHPLAVVLELGCQGAADAHEHLRFLDPRPVLIALQPDDRVLTPADELLVDHVAPQSCDPALIADAILQRLAITKIQANGATHGT